MDLQTLRDLTNSNVFILGINIVGPLGGLLVFSVLNWLKPREISARVREAGGSIFLSAYIKEYGYWWLQVPARLLVAMRVHPTTITLGGLAVVATGSALVGAGFLGLGGVIILLGSLSDMLDGIVARARNLGHKAGEYIDSLVDRYTDFAVFCGLGAYYRHSPALCACIAAAAGGSAMVSYARAKAESLGIGDVPKGAMQRAERAVLLGFSIFLAPVIARLTDAPGDTPWLPIAMCALIAVLANLSTLRMAAYTTAALRRRSP